MRCCGEFHSLAECKPCSPASVRMLFPADALVVVRPLTPRNQNIAHAGGR
jgi:hypothetical protein